MEIYSQLASWVGWPAVFTFLLAAMGFGAWLYTRHIAVLNDEKSSIQRKLTDCEASAPDTLARSLAERYKLLSDELDRARADKQRETEKIGVLESRLEETKAEADSVRAELEFALAQLPDFMLPREGRIRPDLAQHLLSTVEQTGQIYLPVRNWGREETDALESSPYTVDLVYPGMHKTYLIVYNAEGEQIGEVSSPNIDVYDRDYAETVAAVLRRIDIEILGERAGTEATEGFLLKSSAFHAQSPIDRSIFYIKVRVEQNPESILSDLYDENQSSQTPDSYSMR